MKKLIIPFLALVTVFFTSCEDPVTIYDGGQTLAYFVRGNAQLGVPALESSKDLDIQINVSTLSSSDRTVTVSVVETGTTANTAMYSFNSSVVIPANSYTATLTLTGNQVGLSETGDNLVLSIDDAGGFVGSPNTITVSILKTCPFDIANFVGTYSTPSQVYNPASNAPGPGGTVTATAGPEPNLILLTDLFAPGRSAMIELDYSDPDNPTITHRSLEFNAVYQAGTSVGDLFTTEEFASGGQNTFNTCTSGISLNYLRTNGTSIYNWPYVVELTKQ